MVQAQHGIHGRVKNGLHPELVAVLQVDSAHLIKRVFDDEWAEDPPEYVSHLFPVGCFEWEVCEIEQSHRREVDKGVDEVDDGMGFRQEVRVLFPEQMVSAEEVVEQVTGNNI